MLKTKITENDTVAVTDFKGFLNFICQKLNSAVAKLENKGNHIKKTKNMYVDVYLLHTRSIYKVRRDQNP